MPRWVDTARQWVARFAGHSSEDPSLNQGLAEAIDGLSAALLIEQRLGSFSGAADTTPAASLAAAAGRAMGGLRASAWLEGPELLAAHERLSWCAGRSLPLVVHATLSAADGHAGSAGSGHEAWHGIAGTGCVQLLARNVQEVVDLAIVARIVAERALVPVIVGMDREQTAMAIHSVHLPDEAQLRELVGSPFEDIASPTAAQLQLWGPTRRRIPAWFDLARPALLGGTQGPEAYGLGAAARRPWLTEPVSQILADAMNAVSTSTKRPLGPLHSHRAEDARILIVTQGSAAEVAQATVDHLRATEKLKIGLVSLRTLRPFPRYLLQEAMAGKAVVMVLERADAPMTTNGPLAAELRAISRAPTRLVDIPFGLGGLPLRAADLALLCQTVEQNPRERIYLGLDFSPASSRFPRRQATLDALRRDHPELAGLGLRAPGEIPLDVRTEDATTVALIRPAGQTGMVTTLARTLAGAGVAGLRARPADEWLDPAVPRVDRLSFGPSSLLDPGDAVPAEIAVIVPPLAEPGAGPFAQLIPNGTVLLLADPAEALDLLPPALASWLARAGAQVYAAAPDPLHPDESLAAALAALLREGEHLDLSDRAILGSRRQALGADPSAAARLEAFEAGLSALTAIVLPSPESVPAPPLPQPPLAVRQLEAGKGALDGVPAFWSQVGVLYASGHTEELLPDALLASGVVPPLTATFRDLSPTRELLPAFDPALCTGCSKCQAACPDGSIGVVTLSPKALLEAGAEIARAQGTPADGLRPFAGKIAKAMAREARSGPAGAVLAAAVEGALAGAAPDRAAAARASLETIQGLLDPLAVARTAPFFDEAPEPELFGLAIDPTTCKACRSCSAACPTGAITAEIQTPARVAAAMASWRLFEAMPDTPGATIARVSKRPDVDGIGALLLSRHALLAMAGADAAEPGSGDRLCLRSVLGVAEAWLQQGLSGQVVEARALAQQARAEVRRMIGEAVPVDNLDALAEGLAGLGPHAVDLPTLLGRTSGGHSALPAQAAARLGALIELGRGLDSLAARLGHGSTGLGRARLGMVLGPGPAAWWGTLYPYNPFQVPVVDDGGTEAAALAQGLVEAQLAGVSADFGQLRKARATIAGKPLPPLPFRWADLDAAERAAAPPVLLVGDDRLLQGGGLDALLATRLPVRVVILSEADLLGPAALEIGMLATARARGAYAIQSSVGASDHLTMALTELFAYPGPAILRLHAPSPERHGFASSAAIAQANAAIRHRAWPLFRLDPRREGVFGSLIDLEGNPDLRDPAPRPLGWAASEGRYAQIAPDRMEAASAARMATWTTLLELAGAVTPFTAKVQAEAEAAVAQAHQAELAALRAAHQAELAAIARGTEVELRGKLVDRLLALSGPGPQ